jgi:hypothetical protein
LGRPVHVLQWPPYVVRSQNANVLEEKLHDSASWHAGRKRRYFDGSEPPALCNFVAGLCGRVLRNVSEEDVVHRVEAGKLEKIHELVSAERSFFFQFTQRGFMGRFAPTNSSAR